MRLVIDANILIAAFLKTATTRRLLVDERLELYSPEHLLIESQKVLKQRLLKRLQNVTESDFDILFSTLTNDIRILAGEDYKNCLGKALEIAPHEEDTPYLACALHLKAPLWSNDLGMKEQSFVKVFSTEELLKELLTPQ